MPIDAERLRREEFHWMCTGDTVYMNAASTGPLPQRSIDAQVDFTRRRATPHLVSFDEQFGTLSRCRKLVGELINADPRDIALATNTGAGINLAAWGLPLGPGDEVVVPDGEFPANMYPWLGASRERGFDVHVVPLREGILDEDALLAALDRPKVRVLSVSWAGFASGAVADLDCLGDACHARGIRFVVDAIQGLGALTLDVRRTRVDVLACGAQKWLLGPWGSGFTYVRREVMPSITPQPVSWMAVRDSDDFSRLIDYDLTWRDDARRFEQVTLPYQDFAGMAASLELLRELGTREVAEHLHQPPVVLAGFQNAVAAGVLPRHLHHGHDIAPGFPVDVGELLEAGGLRQHKVVGQQDGEGVVADERAGAPDGMPQTQRHLLAHRHHGAGFDRRTLQGLQRLRPVALAECGFQLERDVEMVHQRGLPPPGHHAKLIDPGGARFLDRILDQGLVHHGQHFLGHRLGGGQEAGSEAGDRQDGFTQWFYHKNTPRSGAPIKHGRRAKLWQIAGSQRLHP